MKEVSFVRRFIAEDFLLEDDVSRELYHEYAKDQPIYDYHCQLTATISPSTRHSAIQKASSFVTGEDFLCQTI